jgi:hypothetical protein
MANDLPDEKGLTKTGEHLQFSSSQLKVAAMPGERSAEGA